MPEGLSFGATGFGDELILLGARMTIELALVGLAFGLLVGLALASASLSESRLPRAAADIYTTVIRGIPEFLVVLVVFFGSGKLLEIVASGVFGYDEYIEVSAFAAGVFALGMIFGAYAGEVFRGAFMAVPRGQIEAGQACGMTGWQVFHRIRMPQMWRFALPGLGNLWMVLLKDTSLVSVIALDETLRWSKVAAERTGHPLTFYMAAAAIFLAFTIVSDIARHRLERRANRGIRRA